MIERSTRCSSDLAGVFVDHRRDLDRLAVDGGVELEIDRPHHIRGVGRNRRDRGHPSPLAWTVHPHLQPFLAPEPVDLLLVDLTVLVVAQRRPGPPEPVAGVFGGVGTQPGPHFGIGIGRGLRLRQSSVGGAGQPNGLARQPLRHAQRGDEHVHGAALGGWAQNFPLATSRRASFSSSASASSRLSREFCSRSSLSSLAASVSIPP